MTTSHPQGRSPFIEQSSHTRDDGVASKEASEHLQEKAAVTQMGARAQRQINEAGRTNDSSEPDNPPGAVGAIPTPALKGTYR